MDLKDRVALVAGGTGVLGIAIARALARAGTHVGITYLERKDAARETCAAVEGLGRKAWSVALDQTDVTAIPAAVKAAAGQFGRLDALVNNAGWNIAIPFPDLEALDAATWDRLFATNLRGPYLLCRAAAPYLKASGSGRIVNIASVAGMVGSGGGPAYTASKHGVVGLTKQLAINYADKGITINAIGPGAVQTGLRANTVKILGADAPVMRGVGGDDAAVRAITPAGRRGTLDEIAAAAVYLASREAAYVNGHTLMVDGGWIAR